MPSPVGWDWSAVLDAADLEVRSDEGPDRSVAALSVDAASAASVGPDLDVQSCDAAVSDDLDQLLGGLHGGVRAGLVLVALDHLTSRDPSDGLGSRNVCDVNEGVVLGCEDVDGGEDLLGLGLLGQVDCLVVRLLLSCHLSETEWKSLQNWVIGNSRRARFVK